MAEVALRDYLNEIDNLIERGSIEAALQHSRHILLQYPKAVDVYRLMGKALLEREDDRAAQDVFQRVLSVDPEDFVARVGLSIVHDRNNEVEPAIWHMERAFDIAPSNALIQGELRRLYARRDGEPPERIPLTRDALARMYAQGDLNAEAIADLRQLLHEQPDRIDLQIEMAEVLWRDEQRVDASELTQKLLTTLPYCLKANLIFGMILFDSDAHSESEEPLQRAQAVDPENLFAVSFFGGRGPLEQQTVLVDRLDLQTVSDRLEAEELVEQAEEVPDWLRGISDLEPPLLPESELEHAPRLSTGLHMPDVATEIPDWLQGLSSRPGAAEADVPDWLATLTGAALAGAAVHALTDREEATPTTAAAKPADEAVPDWINQLGATGKLTEPEASASVEDEKPAWMEGLQETLPAPFSETITTSEDTQTPDWLAALTGAAVAGAAAYALTDHEEAIPEELALVPTAEEPSDESDQIGTANPFAEPETISTATEDEQPAWLAELREAPPAPFSETITPAEDTQTPDWLTALTGAAVAGAAAHALSEHEETVPEESATAPTDEETSDWINQSGMVSTAAESETISLAPEDEQPAWLTELREAPPVPFSETITPTEDTQTPDWLAALAGVAVVSAAGAEEISAEPEAPTPDVVAPASEVSSGGTGVAVAPDVPEEMPSADDALAFLAKLAAGKEDQLRAQAEQEADVRMAEIMGRKPAEPKPDEPTEEGRSAIRLATTGAAAAGIVVAATKLKNKLEEPEEPQPPAAPVAAVELTPEVPEEMPSADDALAFLAKLAAGKEDQLRAQAEQEADIRMAAIMGRKPVAEPEPAPEEKPGVGLVGAAAIGAAVVGLAATRPESVEAPPSAEVPETMPSADDALAFLAKLAAGKEDQLRAEAEQEADIRMAAIMGRSAPLKPATSIEPETSPTLEIETAPVDESTDWLAEPSLSTEVEQVPVSDLPDWLKEMRPSEETVAAEPASELPEWLKAMRPDESASSPGLVALFDEESETEQEIAVPATDLPDWLKEVQSDAVDQGVTLEALVAEEEETASTVTPTDELPDWLRAIRPDEPALKETDLEEEAILLAGVTRGSEESLSDETAPSTETLLAELAALEQAASIAEVEPGQPSITLSHDWWAQSAEDTGEEPLKDLPDPFLSPRARAAEREKDRATAAAEEPLRERAVAPQTDSLRTVQKTGPLMAAAASPEVEGLLERISSDHKDYAARLDLARIYWATGNREGAYSQYLELASAGEYTREVTSDLETIVEIYDRPDWHRMLGDVYMKAGKLPQALTHYRRALNGL